MRIGGLDVGTTGCKISVFEQTGDLWEKYNVVEGNDRTYDEAMVHHTMMGWTAGVYMYLLSELLA